MPKLRKLLLLPQACEDFESISEPLRTAVIHRLRLLKRYPKLGVPLVDEFEGWRATTVGVFRVLYRLTARGIEVGSMRHCRRRFPQSPPR